MGNNFEQAPFSFIGYKIQKSSIEHREGSDDNKLDIRFDPSGVIYKGESKFNLELKFNAENSDKSLVISLVATGKFSFNDLDLSKEDLSPLFFMNAPAILFPYIRAYISTLTILSGIKPLLLPTFNLSGLGEVLKQNIEIKD